MEIATDVSAEKGVLSGILRYGVSAYYDVVTLIKERTFTVDANQVLFKVINHIFTNDDKAKLDRPTILSAAEELGFGYLYEKKTEAEYLKALMDYPTDRENIKKFAAKIRKLEIARDLDWALKTARGELSNITGSEKLTDIIGIGEKAIFDFNASIIDKSDEPQHLSEGLDALLDHLESCPVDQVGISTGWPKFDQAIGGGLRPGTVNIIGARSRSRENHRHLQYCLSYSEKYWYPGFNYRHRNAARRSSI